MRDVYKRQGGDLEHPLALDAVNDLAAAALAHAVDNFLVGQHALAALSLIHILKRRQMAMVGDQLYADRMAAALYGIPGLMVVPRGPCLLYTS